MSRMGKSMPERPKETSRVPRATTGTAKPPIKAQEITRKGMKINNPIGNLGKYAHPAKRGR